MANIIWMPSAKESYAEILEELQVDPALRLDDKVEALIENLRSFTNFCPPAKKIPGIRKCIINQNFSLIYSNDQNTVYLIAFLYNKSSLNL